MSVLQLNNTKSHLDRTCFFDQPVDVARYDKVRYSAFEKLTEKQNSFFWRPTEVSLAKDDKDFKTLTTHEKHIFISNLRRQIILDSVQGRSPVLAFAPLCSLPEVENFILTWSYFETIHSRSYTHIIRNIYPNPSVVFDEMVVIPEIAACAADISKYYDLLIDYPGEYGDYGHKRALWLCLNAVNALEGIRFYVSFACSWNFAELKKMEGNAKIIKFIARDENIHLAATQQLLKILPREDDVFAKIQEDTRDECIEIFNEVIRQEKEWASFLFKDGSMIGLNETLTCSYVDYIGSKRMSAIGLPIEKVSNSNPLPWTVKWISGADVQVAPQEAEIESYVIGAVEKDVTSDTMKGWSL